MGGVKSFPIPIHQAIAGHMALGRRQVRLWDEPFGLVFRQRKGGLCKLLDGLTPSVVSARILVDALAWFGLACKIKLSAEAGFAKEPSNFTH